MHMRVKTVSEIDEINKYTLQSCDKVGQLRARGRWFSSGTPFPPPIKVTAVNS
jgi:hypothetical protein